MKKSTTTTTTTTAARKATAGVELMTTAALRVLAVMTMVMLTAAPAWANDVLPWTGDGSKENPYVITTEEELRALSQLSKGDYYYGTYFVLGGNIDMNDGDDGNEMTPIGKNGTGSFYGHFDGKGYTISNLHISGKVVAHVGLFALNNGTITGVTLAGCTVTDEAGTEYTGGIVGLNNSSGTVSGCHITGNSSVSSTGASYYLGGIVGFNGDGTVRGCTSAATVSATVGNYFRYVGGIVGYNGGTVSGCGNTGGVAISGTGSSYYHCGGIVGYIYSGTVSGCINKGAVSSSANGSNYAGGIAGSAESDASVKIENCANGGAVTATGGTKNCAGGIVGYYDDSQYVLKDNFYFDDCTTKGAANNGGSFDVTASNGAVAGYAVTAAEGVTVVPAVSVTTAGGGTITSGQYYGAGMTVTLGDYTGSTPEGFNGYTATTADGSIIVSYEGGEYSFTMPAKAVTVTPTWAQTQTSEPWTGNGSKEKPYIIKTEAGLRALSQLSKGDYYNGTYFVLGDNITMNDEPMAPIGTSDTGGFYGHFDGLGYTISNLHISGKVVAHVGLFARNDGTISGVTLAGCTVTDEAGAQNTGGIVGLNNGTVSGCSNTGSVAISGTGSSDADYHCGGIVGYNSGTVIGCINKGAVSISTNGRNYAGGIVGGAESDASVTIENCANGGTVTASGGTKNYAGGIVGYYDNSQYVLKDNFYFGDCTTKGAANDDGSFDVTNNNGAVAGYAVTVAEGVTGVTVVPAVSVGTITSGQYYGVGMTVMLGDYTGTVPVGFNGFTATTAGDDVIDVSCVDGKYSFTMPAEAVTVAMAFMEHMTDVSYIGADGKAATTPEGVNVWVLSGETTAQAYIGAEGAETWYVVTDSNTDGVDAAFKYNGKTALGFRGDVHLILADGAEMQVGTADGYNNMAGDEGASLTIYGQTAGTGALSVLGGGGLDIITEGGPDGDLTISGGTVTARDIAAQNLTISGGQVTADRIIAEGGDLTISGGQVTAGGIFACEIDYSTYNLTPLPVNIALSRATDYVYAGDNGFKLKGLDACPVNITGTLNAFYSDGKYCGSVSGEVAGDADVFCGKTLRLDVVWGMADGNDGTAEKPYTITTEAGLRALSELSKDNDYYGTYFVLGGNIDMNDGNDGNEMAPIGTSSNGGFYGHFDGKGHTISNLHISGRVDAYTGLFSENYGTISGVTLAGCTVTDEAGTQYTGGIVGFNYGTVSGCHITGNSSVSSTGTSTFLGGIVGYNNGGTVSDCTSAATVSATAGNSNQLVGGIVGYNNGGKVSGCGNTGGIAISGTGSADTSYNCGGIVGYIYSGTVSGCINTGTVSSSVSGDNYAGGIVGRAGNNASVKIENCANGGTVTASDGTTNCAGGIVGYRTNSSQYVLKDNFYFGACTTAGAANYGGSFDITDNNGAVVGYAVTAAEGVTGVTVVPAVSVSTVGGTITSGQYFMKGMTVTLGDYTGTVPEGKGLHGYTATTADGSVGVSFADGNYTFTMPAEAVTVAPDLWDYMTKVSYIDGNGNAATTLEGVNVWVLSDATTAQASLGKESATTWYVVTDSNKGGVDAAFNTVSYRGNVKLILADGAAMKVGNADGGGSMTGEGKTSLEIYGQTAGTGALSLNYLGTSSTTAGGGGTLGINGGKVTADEAISAVGGLVISGGQVTAGLGIYAGYENKPASVIIILRRPTDYVYAGEYGFAGNGTTDISPVYISGKLFSIDDDGSYNGSVSGSDNAGNDEAFKGKTLRLAKYAGQGNTVPWYISDREHNDVVRLANVPTTVPTLTNTAEEELRSLYEAGQIRGIMVAEAKEAAVRTAWTELSDIVFADKLTLFAKDAKNTWATFCADGDYRLPNGCTAYTLSGMGNGTVTVRPMESNQVPAYVPVMIHRTVDVPDDGITASFAAAGGMKNDDGWENTIGGAYHNDYFGYTVVYSYSNGLIEGNYENGNPGDKCFLYGNAGTKGDVITHDLENGYALYNDHLVRIEGNPGISLHRCILDIIPSISGGSQARKLDIVIGDGVATQIATTDITNDTDSDDAWYTLDGRKLDGKPAKKGIYIMKGRKVIVK